jgi:LAO/AO transport system kinase
MDRRAADLVARLHRGEPRAVARAISLVEDGAPESDGILAGLDPDRLEQAVVLGITGPPGAGKSTLVSALVGHYRSRGSRVGVIAIDPTSPLSGGALLGDRIRMMNHALDLDVLIRSMASRGRLGGLCGAAGSVARIMAAAGCRVVIIETVGVGQSEMDIVRLADLTALVLAPGLGDDIQAMKAGLQEVADVLVVNKADRPGADTLVMDLEVESRAGQGEPVPVARTSATRGEGIAQLADIFAAVDELHRRTGERRRRRRLASELEVVDWAVELLRPVLLDAARRAAPSNVVAPRLEARALLASLSLPAGRAGLHQESMPKGMP